MDLFLDSPHLLAFVNCTPPSTRLKGRDKFKNCTSNNFYQTPLGQNVHSVKKTKTFMSSIFGLNESLNETEKEADGENIPRSLCNNEISSKNSEDFIPCTFDYNFSPFMSSSPNFESADVVKTSQNIVPTIEKLDSNFPNSENSLENSTLFEKDSSTFLNHGFDDGNSQNSEKEELKPLLLNSLYEEEEMSFQPSFSEKLSAYPVLEKLEATENPSDVHISEKTVPSEKSYEYVPIAVNEKRSILRRTENYELPCLIYVNKPNKSSSVLDFFYSTENVSAKEGFNVDVDFPLNKLYREQFFGNCITILKTPERRTILNVKSSDAFETSATKLSGEGNSRSKLDIIKYNNPILKNEIDNFEFRNDYKDIIFEDGLKKFQNGDCDLAYNNCIAFRPVNNSNMIPENVSGAKCRHDLRDSWNSECGLSVHEQTVIADNIRKFLNFELGPKFCSNHSINNTKVLPEDVIGVKQQMELKSHFKSDSNILVPDNAIVVPCINQNLNLQKSSSLCATDQQIITYKLISQSGEHMNLIQDIKSPGTKICPEIYVESFMKEKPLLTNDISSPIFAGVGDLAMCSDVNQSSLQVVSNRKKTLQPSSPLELSSNLDLIRKKQDLDYLEFYAKNTDLMSEMNKGKYPTNEKDSKFICTSTNKCIAFPSIPTHEALEDEFMARKKEVNYEDTTFKSTTDGKEEDCSEVDLDDFISASEYYSSSSEIFYEMEEVWDLSDSGSSEENNCVDNMKTPFYDFKYKSVLQEGSKNHNKPQTYSATKSNTISDLFNSNEPVIINYLNEHTQQMEEMLVYSMEYHEKLSREIGRIGTSQEVFEKLIERSKIYVGKPVGIILNVKDIREKLKRLSEERSSVEKSKEKISEASMLNIEQNLSGTRNANSLLGCAYVRDVHCNKQWQSCEGDRMYGDSCEYTVSNPIRRSQQNETVIGQENVQIEDTFLYAVSNPGKLMQNEMGRSKERVVIENNDLANPFKSQICNYPIVPLIDNDYNLSGNKNVYSNYQEAVISSCSKRKSLYDYCFSSPNKKLDAMSLKSASYSQEDKCKHRLHVDKQLLKYETNSCSRKSYTCKIHSAKQQEVVIPEESRNASNFLKYPMKLSSFKLKENLTSPSEDYSCARVIQKYDSISNRQFNDSQVKWSKKMGSPSKRGINIEEIISSDFKAYFNYYAKRGGRLKSGSVISKSNSTYWLMKTGVIYDEESWKITEKSFTEVARKKIVLNIYDYIQFLIVVSRREKICLTDLVERLKTGDI